jgi:tRNA(Ile)-lysidine synthase
MIGMVNFSRLRYSTKPIYNMKDPILRVVKEFLAKRLLDDRPILLGLSGGADSLSLLHLLKDCQKFLKFDLHVVHIDHGWRSESVEEANQLRDQSDFPFYLYRLNLVSKNELEARDARMNCFSKLYKQLNCQALLLGHQANDQAETVMKRILEGSHLFAIKGIDSASIYNGMIIWRPLLSVTKKQLESWLLKRDLVPFYDSTNYDTRYLRAKMRISLFPTLSKQFGKEVENNLCRLGSSLGELRDYFQYKLIKYDALKQLNGDQICIDLTSLHPFERVELKFFIKKISDEYDLGLSFQSIETMCDLLMLNDIKEKSISAKKSIKIYKHTIAIKIEPPY